MGLSLDRLLVYAEDSAHTSGDEGQFVLAVVQDTLASSAGDGDYGAFKVNLKGELYSHDADAIALLTTIDTDTGVIAGDTTSIDATLTALSIAEDSASAGGEQGIQMLAVRDDAGGTMVSADGDFTALSVNATGELRTATSLAAPNTAIEDTAVTVGVTQVALPGTALANRREITIQNRGTSDSVYIGPTGVTTSSGLEIGKRSSMTLALGPSVSVFGISGTASQDVRVFEVS